MWGGFRTGIKVFFEFLVFHRGTKKIVWPNLFHKKQWIDGLKNLEELGYENVTFRQLHTNISQIIQIIVVSLPAESSHSQTSQVFALHNTRALRQNHTMRNLNLCVSSILIDNCAGGYLLCKYSPSLLQCFSIYLSVMLLVK